MAKGTIPGGALKPIGNNDVGCYIEVRSRTTGGRINLNNLPDISDQKGAVYNDEVIMGRSFPLKTYSHSENRTIGMQIKLFTVVKTDIDDNINALRLLESAVYPRNSSAGGGPFVPPPLCVIKCGKLLGEDELCAVLKSYSVKFPTDVPWDETTFLPARIDIDLSFDVVYKTSRLPGQEQIWKSGN